MNYVLSRHEHVDQVHETAVTGLPRTFRALCWRPLTTLACVTWWASAYSGTTPSVQLALLLLYSHRGQIEFAEEVPQSTVTLLGVVFPQ